MLLIGSAALVKQGLPLNREPKDLDYICTWDEFVDWQAQHKGLIYE